MPTGSPATGEPAAPLSSGESTRVRLARLARDAARGVPGVVDTDAGPARTFVTAGDGERVDGVLCAAAPGDGYDVSLRLRCELAPLHSVAAQVRAAVVQAGVVAGASVSRVNIDVVDVVAPGGAR